MANAKKAQEFSRKWKDRGDEKQDTQRFWLELLSEVFEDDYVFDHVRFEKPVQNTKSTDYKDVVITNGKDIILVEQKGLGTDLSKAQKQSDGTFLTPFQQAERYDNNSPINEKARWIIVCDFRRFWVYDMTLPTKLRVTPIRQIFLTDLSKKLKDLAFLTNADVQKLDYDEEMAVSKEAGALVGKLYDVLLQGYPDANNPSKETQMSLNRLCVQIVFLLYAEDAEILSETEADVFRKYLERYQVDEWYDALQSLFKVLNTPYDQRSYGLSKRLASFPYINGGLFATIPDLPVFSENAKELIIDEMSKRFDWSRIIPAIFGAIFESTLNPETRRSGGMHYTSLENIHKVIDPLFLDDLRTELAVAKAMPRRTSGERLKRETALKALQDKLASLKFLDPAAGSGNFLTETYLCLRRMENEIISILNQGFPSIMFNPIKVSIQQFYGIELNDFAVSVARAAMWIAECQMYRETKNIVNFDADFLPLENYENIVEGNALSIDWNDVVDSSELSYIMGNPPFIGRRYRTPAQQKEIGQYFSYKDVDYVACWYAVAAEYMKGTAIATAFVSTNSICQGEQVPAIWGHLFDNGIHINFAHRTFIWNSEAVDKAHVYCVIIGFSYKDANNKYLFDKNIRTQVSNINGYLLDAPDVVVTSRSLPLCDVPRMQNGNVPLDGDALKIEQSDYPSFSDCKYVKRLIGGTEMLYNKERYVLWLVNVPPSEIAKDKRILDRVNRCRDNRLKMKDKASQKLANHPTTFRDTNNPDSYIAAPIVSGESRKYIPMAYYHGDTIPTNQVQIIPDAEIYHFGVLQSSVHMAWMRAVCGRLEMRYRYSKEVVYNNFPWPVISTAQKQSIAATAQSILDARAKYPDASLADMYGEYMYLYPELLQAHKNNDQAVMEAYGFRKDMTETEIVAELMKMYKKLAG